MKTMIRISALLLAIFSACKQAGRPDIHLVGQLGGKLASSIVLEQDGDKVTGYFLNQKDKQKIRLSGVLSNDNLRLEEYNSPGENKLTGIFEGKFDGKQYTGQWLDPNGTAKVPFEYRLEATADDLTNASPNTTSEKQLPKRSKDSKDVQRIKQRYHQWVDEQVAEGAFWTQSYRERYEAKWKDTDKYETDEFWDNCLDGLPDEYGQAHYGDINDDGVLDGWASVFPYYCMGGTWQINADFALFFISNSRGEYDVLHEPDIIVSEIGVAGSVDTILPDGLIIYKALDYTDDDAHCCPSDQWVERFRYKGGNFKKVK